jgi:hypothetical protein
MEGTGSHVRCTVWYHTEQDTELEHRHLKQFGEIV